MGLIIQIYQFSNKRNFIKKDSENIKFLFQKPLKKSNKFKNQKLKIKKNWVEERLTSQKKLTQITAKTGFNNTQILKKTKKDPKDQIHILIQL